MPHQEKNSDKQGRGSRVEKKKMGKGYTIRCKLFLFVYISYQLLMKWCIAYCMFHSFITIQSLTFNNLEVLSYSTFDFPNT